MKWLLWNSFHEVNALYCSSLMAANNFSWWKYNNGLYEYNVKHGVKRWQSCFQSRGAERPRNPLLLSPLCLQQPYLSSCRKFRSYTHESMQWWSPFQSLSCVQYCSNVEGFFFMTLTFTSPPQKSSLFNYYTNTKKHSNFNKHTFTFTFTIIIY